MATLDDKIREMVRGVVREELEAALSRLPVTSSNAPPEPAMLTTTEAATYCGLAARTLYNLKSLGRGPRALKLGRLTRYRRVDLDAWLERSARASVSAGEAK